MSSFREFYINEVAPRLKERLGYTNPMQVHQGHRSVACDEHAAAKTDDQRDDGTFHY